MNESEEKMRAEMKLVAQGYKEHAESLESSIVELELLVTPKKVQEIVDPSLEISSDGRFKIRIEKHPNKDRVSFHTSVPLYSEGETISLFDFPDTKNNDPEIKPEIRKIVEDIYKTNVCTSVSIRPFEVGIGKSPALVWSDILPRLIKIVFEYLEKKYIISTPILTEEKTVVSQE